MQMKIRFLSPLLGRNMFANKQINIHIRELSAVRKAQETNYQITKIYRTEHNIAQIKYKMAATRFGVFVVVFVCLILITTCKIIVPLIPRLVFEASIRKNVIVHKFILNVENFLIWC